MGEEAYTLEEAEVFWGNVDIQGPDNCWLWKGRLDPKRRIPNVHLYNGRSSMSAPRFAYITCIGPVNGDVWVSRDSRNPLCHDSLYCLNPHHMLLRAKKPRADGESIPKIRRVRSRRRMPTGIEPTHEWLMEHRNYQRESIAAFLGYNVDQVSILLRKYGIKSDGKHFLDREFDGGDRPYTPINHDCEVCPHIDKCLERTDQGDRLICEGKLYSIPEEKQYYEDLANGAVFMPVGNYAFLWSLITA